MPRGVLVRLLALLCLLGLGLGGAFLRAYLGPVSADQVMFHLEHGGLTAADPRMVQRALRWGLGLLLLTGLCHWALQRLPARWRAGLWLALGIGATASVHASVSDSCAPLTDGADFVAQHFVDPAAQRWHPANTASDERPDVLVVFMESMDAGYTQARHQGQALLPALGPLAMAGQTFGSLRNLSGAGWTVGGMFTALCGLPLQPVGLLSGNAMGHVQRFYAGGHCLTDLMAAQGWEASFYGGASLQFAGKGQFLTDHSVPRRFGRDEWRAQGVPMPTDGWGVLDSTLTELAWRDMNRPRHTQAPHLSLVLTVDTHGPIGTVDPLCQANPAVDLLANDDASATLAQATLRDALRCTDRAVSQLVARFASQANGRPKVVWLMGDHLAPQPVLQGDIDAWTQGPDATNAQAARAVFHAMLRFDAQGQLLPGPDRQRQFSHLDVMPTLAQAAGLRWAPGRDRLGLGVSLLAAGQPATLVERDGFDAADAHLACRSPLYLRLWTATRERLHLAPPA